jgi:hypothetical protein
VKSPSSTRFTGTALEAGRGHWMDGTPR